MSYSPKGEKQLAYGSDQLRDIACVSKTTMFAEIKAGRLKARRMGRKLLFLHDDAMAWLNGLPAARPSDTREAA